VQQIHTVIILGKIAGFTSRGRSQEGGRLPSKRGIDFFGRRFDPGKLPVPLASNSFMGDQDGGSYFDMRQCLKNDQLGKGSHAKLFFSPFTSSTLLIDGLHRLDSIPAESFG
jgi:hypothetical protein